uniref:Peptidase M12B domain-containing protein n=1 Tax=Dracunculus medinensis TaxID=318479 RepID=A0A0N4UKB2_DRAME
LLAMSGIPNWKTIKTDGAIRYIELLLLVDMSTYIYQLNIRIIVVDVVKVIGYNLTLEQIGKYRKQSLTKMAKHDALMLVSRSFDGGIAYVGGICGPNAIAITGFYPQSSMEYSSVIFHELAHLLGVPHDIKTECSCSYELLGNCLKIDGYDNDCSAQALVDNLPWHSCIQSPPEELPATVLPICGNGVLEPSEECDCGPERFCSSLVCDASACRRTISNMQLVYILSFILFSATVLLFFCVKFIANRRDRVFSNNVIKADTKNIWQVLKNYINKNLMKN